MKKGNEIHRVGKHGYAQEIYKKEEKYLWVLAVILGVLIIGAEIFRRL